MNCSNAKVMQSVVILWICSEKLICYAILTAHTLQKSLVLDFVLSNASPDANTLQARTTHQFLLLPFQLHCGLTVSSETPSTSRPQNQGLTSMEVLADDLHSHYYTESLPNASERAQIAVFAFEPSFIASFLTTKVSSGIPGATTSSTKSSSHDPSHT